MGLPSVRKLANPKWKGLRFIEAHLGQSFDFLIENGQDPIVAERMLPAVKLMASNRGWVRR